MSIESWKSIDSNPYYEVSSCGKIRSLTRTIQRSNGVSQNIKKRILACRVGKNGYVLVDLYRDGKRKTHTVHTLVAEAFIGQCPQGQEVRHGDGNKEHNTQRNLLYGTRSENLYDKRIHGSTQFKPVVRSDSVRYASIIQAAEDNGVTHSAIIKAYKTGGRSAGYNWKRINSRA